MTGDLPLRFTLDLGGVILLGVYRVEQRVASGGMGTVWKGTNLTLGTPVAVKVPDPRLLEDAGFRRRFEHEVRALTRFDHPHVVRILGAGEHQGVPFFVCDFLAGGSLKERLRASGGRQSPDEVLAWLRPVADALDHLHAAGIVHRDVKPANLLFHALGHPVLSDFGIAKALSGDTTAAPTTSALFTPVYAAPEQLLDDAGQSPLSGQADQYALATTAFEALAGRPPFLGGAASVIAAKLRDEAPDPAAVIAHLPSGAAEALARALLRDPRARHRGCAAFAQAFAAGLAASAPATAPGAASLPDPVERADPGSGARAAPGRRRRALLVAGGLLALAGAALALSGGDEEAPPAPSPERPTAVAPPPERPPPAAPVPRPTLLLTAPAGGRWWGAEASATVRGRVDGAGPVTLWAEGHQLPLAPDGGFGYAVELAPGEQRVLRLEAVDEAGRRSEPALVRLERQHLPAWLRPLGRAYGALKEDDGEGARAALAEARAAGAPAERLDVAEALVQRREARRRAAVEAEAPPPAPPAAPSVGPPAAPPAAPPPASLPSTPPGPPPAMPPTPLRSPDGRVPPDPARRAVHPVPSADDLAALAEVNRLRTEKGLPALRLDARLWASARQHSEEMLREGYLGHDSKDPTLGTLGQRVHAQGYVGRVYAEVVAKDFATPQEVVRAWMENPRHRDVLLDPELSDAGFSRVNGRVPGVNRWTGVFGAPK